MSVPSGRLQFFALEATDYLERLGVIVERPTPPDGDEVVRLTRALRGAALMAGLAPFAHAAQAVEHLAKACRDRQLEWTGERAQLVGQAVAELRRLVSRATDWSEADDQAADALADQIGKPAPDRVIEARATVGDEDLKPSVRGFVGREGAQIAGTLEHAAQAVELGQPAETAAVVLQRLQPLRGLAALPRLSPLPEFLDAIELAIRSLTDTAPPRTAPAALRQVARAIGALSRQVADVGVTSSEDPVVMAGAQALIDTFGDETDVVPIASLFPRGESTPIVSRGAVPEYPPQADPQIELTGLADRFRQGADQLRLASSPTSRILILFALSTHLAPLERNARRDRPILGTLLDTVRNAITSRAAMAAPEIFSQHLQEAADELSAVAGARNGILFADRLDGVIAGLRRLSRPTESPAPVQVAKAAVVETGAAATEIVPIESLAPDAPTSQPGWTPFEQSFSSYFVLTQQPAALAPVEFDVLPIESMLYRGRRALERADRVRQDLSHALKSGRPFVEVEPLVSELIDLVPLALAE